MVIIFTSPRSRLDQNLALATSTSRNKLLTVPNFGNTKIMLSFGPNLIIGVSPQYRRAKKIRLNGFRGRFTSFGYILLHFHEN